MRDGTSSTHVTVLLAVRNGVETVERAIASVLHQTYSDWDLLVLDDGSTDGTTECLAAIAESDARVTVLRNERTLGLASSLNRGWRAARGDLIARLDADDACFPDRLAVQATFMNAHPEVAVLGGGAELVDERGESRGVILRPEFHEILAARIYSENPFIHPTVMVRRAFLEQLGGYDERCKRGQDYELWSRAYQRYRFHNLQQPLIRYSVRDRLSWSAIRAGALLIMRMGWREGRIARATWYAVRHFAAGCLNRLGRTGTLVRRAR